MLVDEVKTNLYHKNRRNNLKRKSRFKAEISRLILAYGGVQYVDNRVAGPDWPGKKACMCEKLYFFPKKNFFFFKI
jgi:hypothetical protein